MRLAKAATAFDRIECFDAYSGRSLFKAQMGLYDDTKRDSEAGQRRILSTGPLVTPPTRRVVRALGNRYILGHSSPDAHRGAVLRIGWVAHEATDLVTVLTPGEVCRSQAGFKAWAGFAWIKDLADTEHSSDLTAQFHIHFGQTEPVPPGSIVVASNRAYVIRSAHVGPAGTLITLADDMGLSAITSASVSVGTYDPITETWSSTITPTKVIAARWQSFYSYGNQSGPKFGPEDIQVLISSDIDIKPGVTLTFSNRTWLIEAARLQDDFWMCRAVKHG